MNTGVVELSNHEKKTHSRVGSSESQSEASAIDTTKVTSKLWKNDDQTAHTRYQIAKFASEWNFEIKERRTHWCFNEHGMTNSNIQATLSNVKQLFQDKITPHIESCKDKCICL